MRNKINYILEDIKGNLVNDYEKDIAYLESMFEKYCGYRYERELFLEINEILVSMKFKNEYKDLSKLSRKEEKKYNLIYERAKENIENGKLKDAKRILEKFIFEVQKVYGDNEKIYVSLSSRIEYNLLKKFYKPQKELYNINIKAVEMFVMYAEVLIGEGKLVEAANTLITAINVNPVSADIYYTLAEVYRLQDKLKEFKEAVDIGYKYTYKVKDLGIYYTYRAYLCLAANKEDYASALTALAHHFKASNLGIVQEFAKLLNKSIKKCTLKEAVELISKTKIPVGASKYVYEILINIYTHTTDINVKELYRIILLEYTKSPVYKERLKLSKGVDETKNINKLIKALYKTKTVVLNTKDSNKVTYFDYGKYFPNVIENMIKFEFGLDKHTVQMTSTISQLENIDNDSKFRKNPIYTYCKKASEIKDADESLLNMLDFTTTEVEYENKKENIDLVINKIQKTFKDVLSIKAAQVIINASFIRDVKEENGKLEYTELDFENTTKENKIIETMQDFYKKEIGETKTLETLHIKSAAKEKATYIFKESPYIVAAYIKSESEKMSVNPEIVIENILKDYDGNLNVKDLMVTRASIQKLHNMNVGKELEKKLNEMIVYIAAYSKANGNLPYIAFNIAVNRSTEALAYNIKHVILDIIKYFRYNKELRFKIIEHTEDLKGHTWYAKKQEFAKQKENTFVIMYGENIIEDSMFNIIATAKEYTKKEIAKAVMDNLENRYPCADNLLEYIEKYVEVDYKESEIKNLEYINHITKRFIYNAAKKEQAKKIITEKEVY